MRIRLVLQGHGRTLKEPDRNRQLNSLASPYPLQQNRVSDGFYKETLMPDAWTNDGVKYTIDAKAGVGGVVTAQREDAKTAHSRIVSKLVTREETEKLFENDLWATKAPAGRL
jgi:hypothetical protein